MGIILLDETDLESKMFSQGGFARFFWGRAIAFTSPSLPPAFTECPPISSYEIKHS